MPAICRTNVAVIGRTAGEAGRKYRDHLGRHRAVHARHLHFIVEIGAVAHATDEHGRAGLARRVHHQIRKRDAGQFALGLARKRRAVLVQHGRALFGGKQRGLARVHADRDHQPVRKADGMPHHVEMAVGDRVE